MVSVESESVRQDVAHKWQFDRACILHTDESRDEISLGHPIRNRRPPGPLWPFQESHEYTIECAHTLVARSRTLKAQYEQTWLLEDVEHRIRALRDALSVLSEENQDCATTGFLLTPDHDGSSALIACFLDLAIALGDHYKHTGQPDDLDEQVKLLRLASGTLLDESKLALFVRLELGAALRTRFSHAEDSIDIVEAFNIHSSLLNKCAEDDPSYPRLLYELAYTLFMRTDAKASDTDDDLASCVSLLNTALGFLKESDTCHYMAQYVLAKALWLRQRRGGDVSNLHTAAELYLSVLRAAPSNHPDCWMFQYSLGTCMGVLYLQTHDMEYLSKALEYGRRAFGMVDGSNPNRVRTAINLGISLQARYEGTAVIDDIHESIMVLQSCIDISHSWQPAVISTLAHSFGLRYEALGTREDLDESINSLRRVYLDADPESYPGRSYYANNLSTNIHKRYRRDKEIGDLSEAIELSRVALEHSKGTTDEHMPAIFGLASYLCEYHENYGDREKLEEAIALCETGLGESKSESPHRRGWVLHTYAKALDLRYRFLHNTEDLRAAISRYEDALYHLPAGQSGRSNTLIDLAEFLRLRFEGSYVVQDVERAEELLVDAKACLPDGHPERAIALFHLSRLYLCEGAPFFDIRTALEHLSEAITYDFLNVQTRLTSGLDVLQHLEQHGGQYEGSAELRQALLDVYAVSIELLPRVAYFGLDVTSRLRVLGDSDRLAADGAAHALILTQPQVAIEILEQGRAVFWSQHLRLRTAFNALPLDLATKLSQTALLLEHGSQASLAEEQEASDSSHAKATQEVEMSKQRRLGDDFEVFIGQARALPGFERFMLPETFQALSAAADRSPVVVLLANDMTCQAIIIESPGIVHQVPMPDMSSQRLQTLTQLMSVAIQQGRTGLRDRGMKKSQVTTGKKAEDVFAELWRTIMQLIVDVLKPKRSTGRRRPRVTLCPTGIFAHLPLHAAGIYRKGKSDVTECFSDYLVPSYTPTIGALLNARRQLAPIRVAEVKMLIAAVSQPFKWTRLPFVAEEVERVKGAVPSQISVELIGDVHCAGIKPAAAPTASAVLKRLPEATILHLACHGHQDPGKPLESGFVMQDTMLTVAKLTALNLDKAFLAFLSACETAKGDKAHTDQAIHLAAAMLFAGFKSIVATMWSMGDVDGPIIAETVYEELYRGGSKELDPDAVPYALDSAVRKLRAKGLAASRWAPYVHLGV